MLAELPVLPTCQGSGFYQSRTAFRGGLHPVVLAVRVPGGSDQTAMLRITRPSTGTFGKEIKLKKLLTR